jgi:small-conductance mechanosensitive channel
MFIQPNSTESDPINFQQVIILISNILSACCITFLIFVSWKKGPEWWLNISPYFFFVALIINYLLLPIINILLALVLICDPKVNLKNQTAESYYVFFTIVCISRVVEYFILIRRSILLDARIYL